jgi:hypothetical protein
VPPPTEGCAPESVPTEIGHEPGSPSNIPCYAPPSSRPPTPTSIATLAAGLNAVGSMNFVGHWHDVLAVQRLALRAAAHSGDPTGQAHAHLALGRAQSRLGNLGGAACTCGWCAKCGARVGSRWAGGRLRLRSLGGLDDLGTTVPDALPLLRNAATHPLVPHCDVATAVLPTAVLPTAGLDRPLCGRPGRRYGRWGPGCPRPGCLAWPAGLLGQGREDVSQRRAHGRRVLQPGGVPDPRQHGQVGPR